MHVRMKTRITRLKGSVFHQYPIIFYLVLAALLAFFAVAVVHELIPGLCTADDGNEDTCPFCRLVHALVLVVPFFAALCGWIIRRGIPCRITDLLLPSFHSPANLLRAPPAF